MLLIAAVAGAFAWNRHRAAQAPPAPAPVTALRPALSPAEQALRDSVARLPADADAHRGLARYLLDQRRPFEALWHFRLAHELQPADPDTLVQLARALTQAGHPARAIPLLQTRLRGAPTDIQVRDALAEAYLTTDRVPAALSTLSGAGSSVSTSAPAQLLLGDARWAAGDLAGARNAYQRAVTLEPESATAHDRLGRLALATGRWSEAKQECAAAREQDPGSAASSDRLAQAYWGAGQRADAERLWEEVAAASPHDVQAQVALGRLCRDRGDLPTAAAHLVAAVTADPLSREAQFTLAEVMTAQGDRASAAYQRGLYYLQTDRPDRALTEFQQMAAIAPHRVDAPMMTSLASIRLRRFDVAAVEAERGLLRHPHDARLLAQLGMTHVLGRNRPRATELCQQWLKFDPSAAEPYRLLARVAREEQRLPEAQRLAEQAFARAPQDPAVCSELARCLDALGAPENRRRAIELMQQATGLNPREADYWQQLGGLLRAAGRPDEAADACLRALDLDPASVPAGTALVAIAAAQRRPEASRFYAGLVTDLQARAGAAAPLWRALARHPGDVAAREHLVQLMRDSGDLRRASYQLQELALLRPGDAEAHRALARVERLLDLRGG